jgi:hypothetical protein
MSVKRTVRGMMSDKSCAELIRREAGGEVVVHLVVLRMGVPPVRYSVLHRSVHSIAALAINPYKPLRNG